MGTFSPNSYSTLNHELDIVDGVLRCLRAV